MRTFGLSTVLVLATASASAQPAADPSRGRALADQLCSSCHLVSPDHRGPVPDGIPTFMSLAGRPAQTEDRLIVALLSPPHPAMPNPPLDRQQMRDVAAYILTLDQP